MKKPNCQSIDHPDRPATWEMTLYERQKPPAAPFPKWQGFACDGCFDAARALLKKTGGHTLLLMLRVK